ncbi:hypothetical protein DNI29_04355 [Hymenobacter sediminis]|uniref:hypothetical protein n=1 Tax=Hymenobacter sediminis TaxID=2218621 RepID=UPI000DA69ABA|nr:hypothetical protein [Hymenobacter sediminis]RPD50035.1 hypothetical protein DNI29_04355 [Hymenobacter sediminis]
MEEFEITGQDTLIAVGKFNSKAEAIEQFRKDHPGYSITAINDEIVIGWYEYSGLPVFEGDDYVTDEEGCYFTRQEAEALGE